MTQSQPLMIDPVLTTVLANRIDGIVREMTNTLLYAARSTVIAVARDFSCAIVTADNMLLASAEGLPVHIFGAHLQTKAMTDLHADLAPGDAFIHNDVYLGNSHAADQTIIVPVFVAGEHLFSVCAKAHQADIGNSIPTTYHAAATDIYAEGAVIFPCVRLQRNYEMITDVVRMGMARIRVADQWYGDLLAAIGAARVGEQRLVALCEKYGVSVIKKFIQDWFDYSERLTAEAISRLPRADIVNDGVHDPIPPVVNEPIPVHVRVLIDPDEGMITVDLRDNIDCLPCGLNQSESCATNNALAGVFNCLPPDLPHNSGALRRVKVLLREGSAVGIPSFPHSCSMATTSIADKIISTVQSAFAKIGDGYGMAEGNNTIGPGTAVISGTDQRRGGAAYVNQIIYYAGGGPAGPNLDGWVTYCIPVTDGLLYMDSIELDEVKHPMLFHFARLVPGSGGAGRRRGGPAMRIAYGPTNDPMTVVFASDNTATPPKGVHGGANGTLARYRVTRVSGEVDALPALTMITLQKGEIIEGLEAGGGGYGDPRQREPERVLDDVKSGFETIERAKAIYGVTLEGAIRDETLRIVQT